ncbi:hypothetical protein LCGC14_0347380 [marine sediment metagenome]|uniref:Uncharacterized protein n=1 Tax=marine sediment metagenome TaxID=412755 RepID=A0A0F9VZ13_9ZZZZ
MKEYWAEMKEFYIDGMGWWLARLIPPVAIMIGIGFGIGFIVDHFR